jgi:hypothetical protein
MSVHRAEQIVDAVAALVQAKVEASGVKVFTHRRLSLAADQDELPAISVDFGPDERASTVIIGRIGSVLTVPITSIVQMPAEPEVKTELMRLRREAHRAVMADPKLGLSTFVLDTTYGGAEDPEIEVDTENVIGALTSNWLIYYMMNVADPGD